MLLIEMHDLFAHQLDIQLEDSRPSHVFGFALVTPMFMDEINLCTSLISIKSLLYMCNSCFMLEQIRQIRWKTLGSSLSIHGLINLGGVREKLPRSVRLRYINQGAKERQQAFLALLPGIGNSNPREIYLSFWTNPNFIIVYILCFLFVSMNAGKTLDTKRLRSSQRPYFDKSNLTQAS